MHTAARAAISLVPGFGGPALEFFNSVIAPPIERRRDKWFEEVAGALNDLYTRFDVLPQTLAKNEGFISTLLTASQIAIRTHEQVKLDALRNAIKNSALNISAAGAREHVYL